MRLIYKIGKNEFKFSGVGTDEHINDDNDAIHVSREH